MKRWVWMLMFGCGPKGGIVTFDVPPGPICAGQSVDVRWEVKGPAKLVAEPPPPDWPTGEAKVDSTSSKPATLAQDTTFSLTAVDGDAAIGTAYKSKTVSVAASGDRGAELSCDGQHCIGTFMIPPPADKLTVASLGQPRIKAGGRVAKARLCVEHAGLASTCIDPDQQVSVNMPAAGSWTISVPQSDPMPGGFILEVGFACQR